jgi:1-acyl-sn-glycerol-3-phosphate acyltransferase
MIYRTIWLILNALFRTLLRMRITGASRVPVTGPVILASNHIGNLDPTVVAVGIWRVCAFMAKEELFRNPIQEAFVRSCNAFPVRRGASDRAALKHSLEILKQGGALVMFPEGTRSPTGELQSAESGLGFLAYRSGAPIVPVYIWGSEKVLPRKGLPRPSPISVTYGEPRHYVAPEGSRPGREEYERCVEEIMADIARMRDEHASRRTPDAP